MRAIACTCETKQNKTKKHHHLNKPSPQATNFMVSFYRKISYAPQTNLPFNINAISFIFCYFIKYYLVSYDISTGFTSFFFWLYFFTIYVFLGFDYCSFAASINDVRSFCSSARSKPFTDQIIIGIIDMHTYIHIA